MLEHRTFIAAAAAVVLALVAVVSWNFRDDSEEEEEPAEVAPQEWTYVSEPDLVAPVIDVSTYDVDGAAESKPDDLIFLAPKDGKSMTGPLIVDAAGQPVWIGPDVRAYDLRVQEYEGEPVLTYWRGVSPHPTYGTGEFVIVDQSYEEIATVTTHGIMKADYHELTLTDDGTALLIGRRLERRNLTAKGGPRAGWIADNIVQEVDIETGKVLFEWSSLEHIPISEAQVGLRAYGDGTRSTPYDYSHLNSVTEDTDGSLLISARNTNAVYRVDRETGEVDWRLNGKNSDFTMVGNSRFAWQHDAQRQPDGTITLFDNEAGPPKAKQSRGLRLALDMKTMTARVVTEYLPPDGRLSRSQGNMQVRSNGNVFIGWGEEPYYSEYTADGELLLDGDFGTGESYRAYRLPWHAQPSTKPALAVENGTAYVSWNGATDVAAWRFLAGADAASARDVGTVRREGFETSAEVPDAPYVAAQALDANGRVIRTVVY
jgi:outer membrane protein assembly factor BamB